MMQNPFENLSASPTKKSSSAQLLGLIIGLAGFCAALTILFLSMRAVLNIGGYCAEGGAYQIAVHCPQGVAVLTPLSIFAMLGFAFLYMLNLISPGPNFTFLFWSALFTALGWNFFEFAFFPPMGEGVVVSWIICGVLFWGMGLGPLVLAGRENLGAALFGKKVEFSSFQNQGEASISRSTLIFSHYLAVFLGVYGGILFFNWVNS
jgi:hypothetical protein